MAGHNLRKTYPPPPHSVLWISLWSTLELPIWYVVCFLYIMFLPFDICKKHVSILICSVQDDSKDNKNAYDAWLMTIIILTIVAMLRNFTIILTMMRLEDLTVTETERPRRPPQRGNLGETRAALAPECTTIVISLVEIVISSVIAGSALSTLSSPLSSSLDVGKIR